ncbi:MAG: phenylalanine--tRNA ligase subunit alpha [Bacteroidetes bacterium]|nr:phenylalanine--tRNA ligase subunit alpha [Rhodothermia bacterium]MCS7154649.1 phenylalanine--tRNA ligase subunit alpha [Bacteroidota bacterium]MCX7906366.1 phenylalanine--tRNA ligase subunit alpha [Bacteroidota bacterium]MDW8137442.1 phenylalanine--tRNA ligase subunit alpha [Bacteroidota bacterium]MDW8285604.1 phenylalanine--tRNA ligase subunit alpha [Bacteroidota bacterium]
MLAPLEEITEQIEAYPVRSYADLERFKAHFLGRRGVLSQYFERLSGLPQSERAALGRRLNGLKQAVLARYERLRASLEEREASDALDLTLPGRRPFTGGLHPITQTLRSIVTIFTRMGFVVAEGPEIETDWYNFTALNFPPEHPARDMQDTLFLGPELLLRTHTSPVQVRTMERQQPPIRIIAPGRVYRNETISARSYCLFHQVEGLYVDEGVTMADLVQTLRSFAQQMFGPSAQIRLRTSFFPFTEPSAEVDVSCFLCGGSGCRVCKGTGWVEILGCGMVDPNVFEAVGIDPERYTGYAFGLGVERIAMLRYQIDDIRLFYENDLRFLRQFPIS